jgi:hypothetical protein
VSAVTVAHALPAVSVLVSDETLNRIDEAMHTAGVIATIPERDELAFEAANAAYDVLVDITRDVEKSHKTLKAPALDFGRKLDAAAKDAVAPILTEMERLGGVIKAWQKRENDRREEEARQQREAARKAQEEAQRQAEEAERARIAALPKEDPVPGEDPLPVEEPPVFVAPVKPAVVLPMPAAPRPVTSSVREKKTAVLVIENQALIPDEVGGVPLWLPNQDAIKQLLKAKVKVPGCRLDEITGTAPTGRR